MEADWNLTEAIEYYRGQNVSQDQQALIELLREVQAENGGSIPACALEEITAQLDIRPAILTAILKRCPGLRTQTAPHSLELCAGPRCQKRECARLHAFIEKKLSGEKRRNQCQRRFFLPPHRLYEKLCKWTQYEMGREIILTGHS